MKLCRKCRVEKPETDFSKASNSPDGKFYWCKSCASTHQNAYRESNRTAIRAKGKAYYRATREKRLEDGARYRKTHPEKIKGYGYVRNLKAHNLTPDDYDRMLAAQAGACAICRSTDPKDGRFGSRFCVDHDHACCPGEKSCGKCVRGLLCAPCNRALGMLGDDPWALMNAHVYVFTHKDKGQCAA